MTNIDVITKINGSLYKHFGKDILTTQMMFKSLIHIFEIDYNVQRQLDVMRRSEIREFILQSLQNEEPFYFSPFVFTSREAIRQIDGEFELEAGRKLFINDGQHRMSALMSAHTLLKSKREAAEETGNILAVETIDEQLYHLEQLPISMQIYMNLDIEEEQQMFSDLNSERREAHTGLIVKYDQRDEYSQLTRKTAESMKNEIEIEWNLSRLTAQNTAFTSLTTMRKCLIALFEGKMAVKRGSPYDRRSTQEAYEDALYFFRSWQMIFPKRITKQQRNLQKLSGVQIALAQAAALIEKEREISLRDAIDVLAGLNRQCTWKPEDPMFSHMYNEEAKMIKNHSNSTAIRRTAVEFLKALRSEKGRRS